MANQNVSQIQNSPYNFIACNETCILFQHLDDCFLYWPLTIFISQGKLEAAHPNGMPFATWLEMLCKDLSDLTVEVTVIADACILPCSVSVQLEAIQKLHIHISLLAICDWVLPVPTHKALSMQPECTLFMVNFVALMTVLVPRLEVYGSRLSSVSACSIGTVAEHIFWELWSCLSAGFTALAELDEKISKVWPWEEHLFYPTLFAALHSLLKWLLVMSRSPAWYLMRQEHGLYTRNEELIQMLHQSTSYTRKLTYAPFPASLDNINLLSMDFLPLLSCIATEQFSQAPWVVKTSHLDSSLRPTTYTKEVVRTKGPKAGLLLPFINCFTALVNNLQVVENCSKPDMYFFFLTAPALLHFLKFAIMTQAKHLSLEPDILKRSVTCLSTFMRRSLEQSSQSQVGPCKFWTLYGNSIDMDDAGLPMQLNPMFSHAVLETDVRLLHDLSCKMEIEVSLRVPCITLQIMILQSWHSVIKLHPASAEVMCKTFQATVGLANHCTRLGLVIMQQLQRENSLNNPEKYGSTARQQQKKQQVAENAARVGAINLAIWNEEGMQALQVMMLLVSKFCIQPKPADQLTLQIISEYVTIHDFKRVHSGMPRQLNLSDLQQI